MINVKKSDLTPSQDLVYVGGRFRMKVGRVFLPEGRPQAVISCVHSFSRVGCLHPALTWLKLLGLMAATIPSVELARLRMRPSQFFLKQRWTSTKGLRFPVMVSRALLPTLLW